MALDLVYRDASQPISARVDDLAERRPELRQVLGGRRLEVGAEGGPIQLNFRDGSFGMVGEVKVRFSPHVFEFTWEADAEDDFRPFVFSSAQHCSAEVVFAGYGIDTTCRDATRDDGHARRNGEFQRTLDTGLISLAASALQFEVVILTEQFEPAIERLAGNAMTASHDRPAHVSVAGTRERDQAARITVLQPLAMQHWTVLALPFQIGSRDQAGQVAVTRAVAAQKYQSRRLRALRGLVQQGIHADERLDPRLLSRPIELDHGEQVADALKVIRNDLDTKLEEGAVKIIPVTAPERENEFVRMAQFGPHTIRVVSSSRASLSQPGLNVSMFFSNMP